MRTSFHHQPEAQHPNFPLSASWQADYPIFLGYSGREMLAVRLSHFDPKRSFRPHDLAMEAWYHPSIA